MKVLFVNNDGGGFADYLDLPHGTTVQELFERQMQQAKPENYLIRVDRQAAARDQVLVEGNRVTFTPTKIEGARVGRSVSTGSVDCNSPREFGHNIFNVHFWPALDQEVQQPAFFIY